MLTLLYTTTETKSLKKKKHISKIESKHIYINTIIWSRKKLQNKNNFIFFLLEFYLN